MFSTDAVHAYAISFGVGDVGSMASSDAGKAKSGFVGDHNTRFRRILIIDDDKKFSRLLHDYLKPFGFELHERHDGLEGIRKLSEGHFDALILDLMLPGIDGIEVLRRLGPERQLPVLMLTARGEEPDRIIGLEMGADDYVSKTVSPREILARVRALTRRYDRKQLLENDHPILVGELEIHSGSRSATLRGESLSLTSFEFDLMLSLARSVGRVKTRDQLLMETASRLPSIFDRSVDVHISSLRRKLGDDSRNPEFIVTVRNTGYMMRGHR
jgi:two-component system, OmpR family, response regulator CpxR